MWSTLLQLNHASATMSTANHNHVGATISTANHRPTYLSTIILLSTQHNDNDINNTLWSTYKLQLSDYRFYRIVKSAGGVCNPPNSDALISITCYTSINQLTHQSHPHPLLSDNPTLYNQRIVIFESPPIKSIN